MIRHRQRRGEKFQKRAEVKQQDGILFPLSVPLIPPSFLIPPSQLGAFTWGSHWRWERKRTRLSYPELSASQQISGIQWARNSRAPGRARRCSWGHTGGSGSGAGWCHCHNTAPRGCTHGPHTRALAGRAIALSQWECLGRQ